MDIEETPEKTTPIISEESSETSTKNNLIVKIPNNNLLKKKDHQQVLPQIKNPYKIQITKVEEIDDELNKTA